MTEQGEGPPGTAGTGEVRAAGAVLWRPAGTGLEVALIHRNRYGDWTFPKGKALPGEHVLVTAAREVAEETGIRVVLGRRLGTARYPSGGKPKRVDYWAAQPAADEEQAEFVPNDEVDDLRWLPLAAAREWLSYPHDVELLGQFATGPAATVPVILVRHAWARAKQTWLAAGRRDDRDRPLTPHGQAQARELAEILCCFGPARVVSSAMERCLATVRPFAAAAGTEVEADPVFSVGPGGTAGPDGGGDAARERITGLVAAGEPVVVCAHRENMPSLLGSACEALGAARPAGPRLPKGGFWVLHTASGRLAAAERHRLTA